MNRDFFVGHTPPAKAGTPNLGFTRKAGWILLLSGLLVLSGCARNYVLTLSNGTRVTATSKPRLKNGYYIFTDTQGKQSSVSAGRVTVIEPASMAKSERPNFGAEPAKR